MFSLSLPLHVCQGGTLQTDESEALLRAERQVILVFLCLLHPRSTSFVVFLLCVAATLSRLSPRSDGFEGVQNNLDFRIPPEIVRAHVLPHLAARELFTILQVSR